MNILTKAVKNPLVWIIVVIFLYVSIPFLAPISFRMGNEKLGVLINKVYEPFCHQRVERSVFLFGESRWISFHSVAHLKDLKVIPEVSQDTNSWPEYFGHGFYGNEDAGYRVPICIRDIALYGSLVLAMFFLLLRDLVKRKSEPLKISWKIIILLMAPMIIDGVAQTIVEALRLDFVSMAYINDIPKRIVTGSLFGISIAIAIYKLFQDN